LAVANYLFSAGEIEAAGLKYLEILAINPKDPTANSRANEKGYIELLDLGIAVQAADIGRNVTYETALLMCDNSTIGGFNNWRLPEPNELMSLFMQHPKIGNFTSGMYYGGVSRIIAEIYRRHTYYNGEVITETPYEQGFVYSETSRMPSLNDSEITDILPSRNMKTNTTYYYRPYQRYYGENVAYGEVNAYTMTAKAIDFKDGNIISLDNITSI
jgi:hypothetical protein